MKRKLVFALALCATALIVAACGSSSKTTSAGSGGTSAGTKGSVKIPHETIGLLFAVKATQVTLRGATNLQAAAKVLGWSVNEVDAAGDPQKAAAGMSNLVTQGSNLILDNAWGAAVINQGLQAAKSANIPVLNIWGGVPATPLLSADYSPNEPAFGAASAPQLCKMLPHGGQVALLESPLFYFGQARDAAITSALKSHSDFSVVATHSTDYSNAEADTTTAVTSILAAHPQLSAIWADSSTQIPEIAAVLKSKGLCGKVKVVGFYGDLASLAAIRDGCVQTILDVSTQAQSWAAMDQIAGALIDHKPYAKSLATAGYPFNPMAIEVVTKANVPSNPNQYVDVSFNYRSYFEKKWAAGKFGT